MHQKSRTLSPARILLVLLFLLSLACTAPVARRGTQVAGPENSQATQAAILVQTEIARPSAMPTPTVPPTETPTPPAATAETVLPDAPLQPQVTALDGLALYTHPDIPDYVFQIDPAVWEKDPGGETANLFHTGIDGCEIKSVPGHGLGDPQRYYWEDLGRFRWEVMEYGTWAYVSPVLGAGLGENKASFLELDGYNRGACRAAQEEVLANLMSAAEAAASKEAGGQVGFVPFASPTPRAALENFSCPDMPEARLRVGDYVSIATNGLWLRSEPRADNSTKVTQYMLYAPVMVRVIGGPVCEKYVYWQVEVSGFGEGAETITGWMAEGEGENTFLLPVK